MIKKLIYNTIVLGGTFDHLHDGHKDFIEFAAEISKFLIIGVADKQMTLKKSNLHLVQPNHIRKQAISNFCGIKNIKAKVITISDPFGPTIEKNGIQAIACTTDTVVGAEKINEIREKLHLGELPIHIHKLKKDSLGTGNISAERIRSGEIDRKGNVYLSLLQSDLALTEKMRTYFSKLKSKTVQEPSVKENQEDMRLIIGDTSLEKFIIKNWDYDLGIFDGKRQRKKVNSDIINKLKNIQHTSNKPGIIEKNAAIVINNWFSNKNFKHLFVEGEEDLTAVIAILTAPLGTYIYYGQPNQGMVECLITENLKEDILKVLSLK